MELAVFSYFADLVFGDPSWFPHPVRAMGRLINFFDEKLPRTFNKNKDRLLGVFTAISLILISAVFAYLLINITGRINVLLGKITWIFIGYTTLATKDLVRHAISVKNELVKGDIVKAREKLSRMVGRDTHSLPKQKIVSATVESVAENTSDGVIAPLFYLFIGGPVLAISYKAINTLDSMLAHKNKKYLHFGWFSAKLDDIANFIPARITGLFIVIGSFLLKKDTKNSFSIMVRDGRKHSSPNSAISEAAIAGALGIKLGGPCSYDGREHTHPFIGEAKREINTGFISEAVKLSVVCSILMVALSFLVKQIIF